MATATKTTRAVSSNGRGAVDTTRSAPRVFRIFENNGGDYQWAIESASGEILAMSGAFASYEAAETAATCVRDGASAAKLEKRAANGDSPVTP